MFFFFFQKVTLKKLSVLLLFVLSRSFVASVSLSPRASTHPPCIIINHFQSLATTSTTPRRARSLRASAMSFCKPAFASGTSRNVATPRSSERRA